jgi:hypothetical protein
VTSCGTKIGHWCCWKGRLKPVKTPSGSLNALMNIRKSLGKGGENQKKDDNARGMRVQNFFDDFAYLSSTARWSGI